MEKQKLMDVILLSLSIGGPASEFQHKLRRDLYDFLADRFSVAMIEAHENPYTDQDLRRLFEKII